MKYVFSFVTSLVGASKNGVESIHGVSFKIVTTVILKIEIFI